MRKRNRNRYRNRNGHEMASVYKGGVVDGTTGGLTVESFVRLIRRSRSCSLDDTAGDVAACGAVYVIPLIRLSPA